MEHNVKPSDNGIAHVESLTAGPVTLSEKPGDLLRDRHGFVLIPQPTRFRDDPLVSQA
jgi:hypothetical protein